MDPAPPKICVFCNQDCSRRPRSKDSKGRYMCHECLEKRKIKTGDYRPAMTRVVVVDRGHPRTTQISLPGSDMGTGDPEHTVIGADPTESFTVDTAGARPSTPPANAAPASHKEEPQPRTEVPPGAPTGPDEQDERDETPVASAGRHTAVVWVDPGRPRPQELFDALVGRGIDAVEVGGPYQALAEVCRLFRARAAEPGTTDKREGLLALVTVSPEDQAETCAICEAVARYAAGTPCWMFGPARAPRLRPILEGDLAEWKARGELAAGGAVPALQASSQADDASEPGPIPMNRQDLQQQATPATTRPHLRLAGTEARAGMPKPADRNADLDNDRGAESPRGLGSLGGTADADEAGRPPLLSAEELSMLLGDEDAADR
jgi:hypothetical protein